MGKSGIFIALTMGAIQGIFEWLPVSSHLVINYAASLFGDSFLNHHTGYGFWLHLGTMFSILVVFRKNLIRSLKKIVISKDVITVNFFKLIGFATSISLFIGALFFFLVGMKIIDLLGILVMASIGFLLLSESVVKNRNFRKISDFNLADSFLVGVFQGLSVIPGVSRSGVVISILVKSKLNIHNSFLLNCYLNIPLSLASSIYIIISDRTIISYYSIVSLFSSFVVGVVFLVAILKIFKKFEERKLQLLTSLLILCSCSVQVFF